MLKSQKKTEEDFNSAFRNADNIIKKTNSIHKLINTTKPTQTTKFNQTGGETKSNYIIMDMKTVFDNASNSSSQEIKDFYTNKIISKMTGEIINGNKLIINEIHADSDVKKQLSINITDTKQPYSNYKYDFYINNNQDTPLDDIKNTPGSKFFTKPFLFVDISNVQIKDEKKEVNIENKNMTEQIINFLLHTLVQYNLAKTILCVYDSTLVTSLTVTAGNTLTSYDFSLLRLKSQFSIWIIFISKIFKFYLSLI